MKRVLRQGGYDSLNVYFLSDWNPTYYGGFNRTFVVCQYPLDSTNKLTELAKTKDGCIMQQYTMPGEPGINRTESSQASWMKERLPYMKLGIGSTCSTFLASMRLILPASLVGVS